MTSTSLTVVPVRGERQLARFIAVPREFYRDDPNWVPPLWIERRLHLSRFNPFFEHGEWQGFVALRGGRAVGRISAQIDHLHREHHGPDTGHFGFLEAEDEEVLEALTRAAEGWLRARGTVRVTGPFAFSINQESGLLVEGFDSPPLIMMPHNRPWYGAGLEALGYRRAQDLLAYWVELDFGYTPAPSALMRRYEGRIAVRNLDRKRMAEEAELLRDMFNDAWSENWGFVPFTKAEFKELANTLGFIVDDGMVLIAEMDGEPMSFIVGLPNLNEPIKEIDGRLLPLGWRRLWSSLKKRKIRWFRVPLMGVRKKYQHRHAGMASVYVMIERLREAMLGYGMPNSELSWLLESNHGIRSIVESIGCKAYKRYRIYEKQLTLE